MRSVGRRADPRQATRRQAAQRQGRRRALQGADTGRKVARGEVYKWKIIVEDETGAMAESETRRFEVK
jgi:hypothetical protein